MSIGRKASLFRRTGAAAALLLATPLLQGNIGLLTNFDDRVLAAHNRERSTASLPSLQWDEALAADAAEWGEALTELGDIEHYPEDPNDPDPQGENLFLGTRAAFAPEEMVDAWVEEKRHFKPGVFPNNSRTGNLEDVGHYTQLMWRDTERVGCALARGEYDILVCRYSTAGNVIGQHPF